MAFGVDTVSRRKYTLHFKNLATGQTLPDEIATTTGSAAWASDNKTVFYTVKDDTTLRAYKIMRHVLGTPAPADDQEIFVETDETFDIGVYMSKSKKIFDHRLRQHSIHGMPVPGGDNPDGRVQGLPAPPERPRIQRRPFPGQVLHPDQ